MGACDAPNNPVDETGDATAGDGDGDGDGDSTGDGDGDTTGDGDGDGGDGDGDGDGDDNGEGGDGDREPYDGWCEVCVDPPPNMSCNLVAGPMQNVAFTTSPKEDVYELDEDCTVSSVSATQVQLGCQSYETITIDLMLNEPWTPNFEVGATLHLTASAYNTDWLEVDWRLDHLDQTLAIAGRHAFYYATTFESIGLDTIPVGVVIDACTPDCYDSMAERDVGLTFEFEGEQATLFSGGHDTIAEHAVWVTHARKKVCDLYIDQPNGHIGVFVSGKPKG
ncbi:hypothetical protein [Enhygromyxa salina]|uniref:hypothetical protein n=1 Tax=Enhygromyxa salina TaxID=215803 RepID=UPI0015E745D2|nr:hypothetical protein [Enhygromyxa salina]